MTAAFAPRSPRDVASLIEQYPLAWIVCHGAAGFGTAVLPLIAETDESGTVHALFGHIPLAHPLVDCLRREDRALILFQGPQGYVSPEPLSNRNWAPTWNFAVTEFDVQIHFVPEETHEALAQLVKKMEMGRDRPWTAAEMGERYNALAARVVAFRAHVVASRSRFKLGQDERPEVLRELLQDAGETPLAQWMRHFNHDRL